MGSRQMAGVAEERKVSRVRMDEGTVALRAAPPGSDGRRIVPIPIDGPCGGGEARMSAVEFFRASPDTVGGTARAADA